MRLHQVKMNPTKSFLGVSSGKFLGFIITSKGIHLDPEKISAIRNMEPPWSLKELRGLQGKLAYIQRFISNLSGRCQCRLSKYHCQKLESTRRTIFKWDSTLQLIVQISSGNINSSVR